MEAIIMSYGHPILWNNKPSKFFSISIKPNKVEVGIKLDTSYLKSKCKEN